MITHRRERRTPLRDNGRLECRTTQSRGLHFTAAKCVALDVTHDQVIRTWRARRDVRHTL